MTVQLPLFTDGTVPSPLCIRTRPCGGRAVYGPAVRTAEGRCRNRAIRCMTCGAEGEESTRMEGQ